MGCFSVFFVCDVARLKDWKSKFQSGYRMIGWDDYIPTI